jgi:Cysteine-rich CPCC
MSHTTPFPCPVCGYLVFNESPGSYDICPICFWEDDLVQLGYPLMAGGANKVSLHDAQRQFMRDGAVEFRFVNNVRRPTDTDRQDPQWRPFDPDRDLHLRWDCEADHIRWHASGIDACLYYWRENYWLSQK